VKTFLGALDARRIPTDGDRVSAAVAADARSIRLRLHVRAEERHRAAVERVHRNVKACPLHKTLSPEVAVHSELHFEMLT
jgi:uncharacterized OsmC-like protein